MFISDFGLRIADIPQHVRERAALLPCGKAGSVDELRLPAKLAVR